MNSDDFSFSCQEFVEFWLKVDHLFFLPQARESYLKCRRVEKDVGGLCDVCSVHTVVVRNVLKNIIKVEGNDGGCCKRRQQHCTLLRNGLPSEVGLE